MHNSRGHYAFQRMSLTSHSQHSVQRRSLIGLPNTLISRQNSDNWKKKYICNIFIVSIFNIYYLFISYIFSMFLYFIVSLFFTLPSAKAILPNRQLKINMIILRNYYSIINHWRLIICYSHYVYVCVCVYVLATKYLYIVIFNLNVDYKVHCKSLL